MSRTRRRKHWGEPGKDRDGTIRPEGAIIPRDFTIEVQRRDRRTREDEVGKLQRGEIDPDDLPVKPVRKRLWQFWKRW